MPDNNLPQKSGFSGTPNNEENLVESTQGEELEQTRARVVELEELIANKDEELASRDTRISELEQAMADRDNQITTHKQSVAELDQRLIDLNNRLSQAVSSYRAVVVRSNSGVLEELITGDTIEAIDKSVEDAQTLISKVKEGLEAEMAMTKVPAGAPQRTPLDLSALSPRDKIQYGIGERR